MGPLDPAFRPKGLVALKVTRTKEKKPQGLVALMTAGKTGAAAGPTKGAAWSSMEKKAAEKLELYRCTLPFERAPRLS